MPATNKAELSLEARISKLEVQLARLNKEGPVPAKYRFLATLEADENCAIVPRCRLGELASILHTYSPNCAEGIEEIVPWGSALVVPMHFCSSDEELAAFIVDNYN